MEPVSEKRGLARFFHVSITKRVYRLAEKACLSPLFASLESQ